MRFWSYFRTEPPPWLTWLGVLAAIIAPVATTFLALFQVMEDLPRMAALEGMLVLVSLAVLLWVIARQKARASAAAAVGLTVAVIAFLLTISEESLWTRVRPAPGEARNLTKRPDWDNRLYSNEEPSFSRDGRIAFKSNRDGNWEIYVMGRDGSNQWNLTNHTADEHFPSWSPDGQFIAFASNRTGKWEIYVQHFNSGVPVQLTNTPGMDSGRPSFSPNGKWIVFDSDMEGKYAIYLVVKDGQGLRRLTNDPAADDKLASFSPDGRTILHRRETGVSSIMELPIDENGYPSGPCKMLSSPVFEAEGRTVAMSDWYPSYSPEGKWILFASLRGPADARNADVYVRNRDTGEVKNLTNHPAEDNTPTFSRDGRYVAFSSDRDSGKGNKDIFITTFVAGR